MESLVIRNKILNLIETDDCPESDSSFLAYWEKLSLKERSCLNKFLIKLCGFSFKSILEEN